MVDQGKAKDLKGAMRKIRCRQPELFQAFLEASQLRGRAEYGQRCGYFEKCLLGTRDYKYKLPGYDYAKLFAQYADQTGAQTQRVKVWR